MPGRSYNVAFSGNQYKYNGKELDDENGLDWLHYGQRDYDPVIGRFHNVDRFDDMYPSQTPFHYAQNNPILFIDVNGDSTARTNDPYVFEETESIVATAENLSPSWYNPLTWASWFVFGESNYYYVLFGASKKESMNYLAAASIAFIPGAKGGNTGKNIIKSTVIGFTKGTGKSILNPKRLQHAARHLIEAKILPNWSNATKKAFSEAATNIVENPIRTFDKVMRGGTSVKGFVGTINGREVTVFVSKGGQVPAGEIMTVIPK
jgi:RHS repeat-associated protein